MTYSHRQIEKKWIDFWIKNNTFRTDLYDFTKPKIYLLGMFPYPSGSGLHVGHIRGYLATDILARMKKMQGFNVLHPIGFDSFGLPTEQYAIKTGNDPASFTQKNISNFLNQLQTLGFAYDYKKLIYTSDPKYYKWTQWSFQKMYESNLAQLIKKTVNYCPDLNTVLANEEIVSQDGKMVSERGGFSVIRRHQKQWVISLRTFANSLLSGLAKLDWPEAIKKQQIDWIGKTIGYKFTALDLQNQKIKIDFFYDDPHVWSDATFLGISFDNENFDSFLEKNIYTKIQILRKEIASKNLVDSRLINQKPLGLKSNFFIKNPITEKVLPVYFVEYIDSDYAFGTRIGNPLFDVKDWHFANHHQINKIPVKPLKIQRDMSHQIWKKELVQNKKIKSLTNPKNKITFFKIKDWIFSRQRYWGEPFPLKIHEGKITLLKDHELPLVLPKFTADLWKKSTTTQEINPLGRIKEWVSQNYDTNTMPQWAGSCWYFLAFILFDKNNYLDLNSPLAKKLLNHWMPVDLYIGGQEHAVSHLIYSRFWNYFLKNIGILDFSEPFQKLLNQGMILSSSKKKMSKSKGNVVNPLDFILSHGADAIRLHEKFLGPFSAKIQWDEQNLDAMRKWLARVYRIFTRPNFWQNIKPQTENIFIRDKVVKEVTENYENLFFNVAISKLMGFINYCYKQSSIPKSFGLDFLKLLHPICPHITEELANNFFEVEKSLARTNWPTYSEKNLELKTSIIVLQIDGKFKKILVVEKNQSEKIVIFLAKNSLSDWLINKKIIKYIYVKNKAINFLTE